MSEEYTELVQYLRLLQAHDWTFEHSDDQSVWHRGVAELDLLRGMQRRLDPDLSIWNVNCPPDFRQAPPEGESHVRQENA